MDQAVKGKMQKTIIGFVPAESPMYAVHPVVRFWVYIATGILPLFIEMPEISIVFILVLLGMFVFSNVNLKRLKIFAPMMVTVGIIITLTYLFFPIEKSQGLILFKIGFVEAHFYSIMWAFCIYLRIITLVLASVFYFSTNRERDILVSLRTIGIPFAVSYFVGLALRSAGIFLEDYAIIREAEQARGLDVRNLSLGGKIKHFSMYLVPLFTSSIRKCEDISIGLFAKGTEISGKIDGVKRADYLRSKFVIKNTDKLWIFGIFTFSIALIILQIVTGFLSLENSWTFQTIKSTRFGL
jgi:energy-coupling factor transporter transmembrane protein EcfT